MTPVPVKEPKSPPPPPAPRRWSRKCMLGACLGAALALILFAHFVIVPWLLRDRVFKSLRDAGIRDVEFTVSRATLWGAELRNLKSSTATAARVRVDYSPLDLWNGKIDTLRIESLRYAIEPSPKATTQKSKSVTSQVDIPISKIELVNARIDDIPLNATIEKQPTGYHAEITAGESAALSIDATVGKTLRDGKVRANAQAMTGDLLHRLLRLFPGDVSITVNGKLNGNVNAEWNAEATRVIGKLELTDGNQASENKLNIWAGVYSGEARFGPATRPSMALSVEGADLATPDLVALGVTGTISFVDLDPPITPGPQKLSAAKLKLGEMELTDGQIEFEVQPTGDILVNETRWDWLGGELFASEFAIPSKGALTMNVNLRAVQLAQVLELLAKEKASGDGQISGELPVTIDGGKVTFGDGKMTSIAGGTVQIKDAATLAPAGEAAQAVTAAGASQEQIKKNIIEALKDFQYDRLTGRLVNGPNGLSAFVRLSGHGRTGAQQALDYELRVHGIDAVLRSYTGFRQAMDQKRPTTGKAGP